MNARLALSIYDRLFAHYGDPHWWPANSPYEVMVGAVLTQNCAWGNVVKAIANFGDRLFPESILNMDDAELIGVIHPAGFFNQKVKYLKAVTEWFNQYNFDVETVRREPLPKLRRELLSVRGIGNETADSILLYAFDLPTFVVDAYTVRLNGRVPLDAGETYDEIKRSFELSLAMADSNTVEIYNRYHALIVLNAQEHCRKKPSCAGCPLADLCKMENA